MSFCIAHRRNNASNALDVPSSTVQKETSSVYDKKQSICMSESCKLFGNKFHVVYPVYPSD